MAAAQMTAEWQKHALFEAINQCDTMVLQADIDNDAERRDPAYDAGRLARCQRLCNALTKHRELLENLYKSLYNHV